MSVRRRLRTFQRVRRPADLLLAVLALAIDAVLLALVHALPVGSQEISNDIAKGLLRIPRWLSFGASVITVIACLLLAVIILSTLVRREAQGALNAGAGAAVGAVVSLAASAVWRGAPGTVSTLMLHGRNPSTLIFDATFIAFVTASDLVRRPRWFRWCVLGVAALIITGAAVGALAPLAVLVVLFGGTACGWAVRWLLGAASVRPSIEELKMSLQEAGIAVATLEPDDLAQKSRLEGTLDDGTPIEVRLADRDIQGSGILRRLWAFVRLRPGATGHQPLTSRSQLERIALVSYLVSGTGVLGPGVRLLTEVPTETLVLVTAKPCGRALQDVEDVRTAASLFRALRTLHQAGIAHRDLRADSLVVGENEAGFASLDAALPGAGELVRRLDVTQLLTTLARVVGAQGAVRAMRDAYKPEDEAAIASILQPIALAPWGWAEMREARSCINDLRRELVGARTEVHVARLERFRWRTVISAIALTIAAFVLVGQLSTVNLLGALGSTNLAWFAVAIVGSAITYIGAATSILAFVPKRISLLRCIFVQLATSFVGVAMPPTVGHVALNARFLHREQLDEGSITAALALTQVVNVLTTIVVLLVIGLLTGSGISRFHIQPSADVLLALAASTGLVAILMAIPVTRGIITHRVWPRLQAVWPRLLEALSQPLRLAAGVGGNLLLVFGYGVAFIASIQALGGHPPLLPAAAVFLAGNAVGSAAPTPGGIGAVEAVLSAGLTALGIPAHQAIPAVLVFRVATFWLPIPIGWASFVMLQRREIL